MKYLLLFFVSTSAFAFDYWKPHDKDRAALAWKAANSPEERLSRRFSRLENMDFVRESDEPEFRTSKFFNSIEKIGALSDKAPCSYL
jgi:hypothetical protein